MTKATKYTFTFVIIYYLVGLVVTVVLGDDEANTYLRELTSDLPNTFLPWLGHLVLRFVILPLIWPANVGLLFI